MSKENDVPYGIDFSKKPPVARRVGKEKLKYTGTISAFIESGEDSGMIIARKGEEFKSVMSGLKGAIDRLGKSNDVKVISRDGVLYLITKRYSDKQGWMWKVPRRAKTKKEPIVPSTS